MWHDDVIKWKHFPRYWTVMRGVHRWPTQRPVTRSFDVFIDLCLNKRQSKQSWGSWRHRSHCDVTVMIIIYHFYFTIIFANTNSLFCFQQNIPFNVITDRREMLIIRNDKKNYIRNSVWQKYIAIATGVALKPLFDVQCNALFVDQITIQW